MDEFDAYYHNNELHDRFDSDDPQDSSSLSDGGHDDYPTEELDAPVPNFLPMDPRQCDSERSGEQVSARMLDIECYINIYKDYYGTKPRHVDFDLLSDAQITQMIEDFDMYRQADYDSPFEEYDLDENWDMGNTDEPSSIQPLNPVIDPDNIPF